jgi:hypothetical protein
MLSDFKDVFDRYLPRKIVSGPVIPIPSVTPSQTSHDAGSSRFPSVTHQNNVTLEKPLQPSNGTGCDVVTDKNGGEACAKRLTTTTS